MQTPFAEAGSWSRADSKQILMCIVVLHFTIMLNFPLQDFAFYTDGYFMEFAKDIARPELSMDMNLIWFVLVVPNA